MRRINCLVLLALSSTSLAAPPISPDRLSPMKWVEPLLPEKLPPLTYPEYADPLDKAQQQIQAGRYRLALQTLRIATKVNQPQQMALMAQALYASGQYAQVLQLSQENQPLPRERLYFALALAETGKFPQALQLLEQLWGDANVEILARWHAARLLDETGRAQEALTALAWFETQQKFLEQWRANQLDKIESAEVLVAIASALDRQAVLRGDYRDNPQLHQAIMGMMVRAYDVLDRRSAEAHVSAAEFFLRHDDSGQAQQEIAAALRINPNCLAAHQLGGHLDLAEYNFDACEQHIAAIRHVLEDHPAATLLTVEMLLLQRQAEEAQGVLRPLLAMNPSHPHGLALQAACEALRYDPQALARRLKEYCALYPQSAQAHLTAAACLVRAMQFEDAIPLLEEATAIAPNWNEPRNLLALAYMQGSDTEKARPLLLAARQLDPFNIATTNYIRLLDELRSYSIERSAHFAVRFNPRTDPFLAGEILTYMEENYYRICGEFGHEPGQRTIIELMPTAQDFSVRTSGKPWVATIGASTGPVITMVAPRNGGKTNGNFDWTDVTRHEFVHTVTISATHGRIPRWFTEGLAVAEQTSPLDHERASLLASAVNHDRLFPVRRINWSFIRPRRRTDSTLAYSQSFWLCRYIQEKYGHAAILKMLNGFGEGKTIDQVTQQCLGLSSTQFDEQFAAWARKQVKALGLDPETQSQLTELKKQIEELLKEKDFPHARDACEKAYALCPVDPAIHQRLAGLYLLPDSNQARKAIPHLRALDADQLKDNRYAIRLARLYESLNEFGPAIACARRASEINPYDPKAREIFARVLAKVGDTAGAEKQQAILKQLETDKAP